MKINLPEFIYKILDFILIPFVNLLVPYERISRRLQNEQLYFEKDWREYSAFTLSTLHERASTMVGHLSLMLGVCLFILQSSELENKSPEGVIVTIDAIIYISLVILSVRALRSFGLDRDRDLKEYEEHIRSELIVRYSIMQIVNSLTIVATIFIVIALLIHVWK
ncbi:hypothetical protein [Amphritea balenae]|uniref:Uncharacterized protein n=1 Tax=Amphritea balenae TaxID=452629 RepID=A0A3P1SMI1_9GAMM|nr:hypothetical protein [Amphritea balenae]RRC98327.1 hypothetical protein EHS89_14660 [Amphritea balenae]GGK80986.1 hypothetical protein GCM10007941_34260 [Amphritea balenae]